MLNPKILLPDFPQLNPNAIDSNFPMENYRDGQKEIIEYTVNAFNNGKSIVILECPVGSGKSPIGMTIANMVKSSYYLTITKILQDQLITDFGDQIVELKGRNAYPCTFYKRYGQSLVNKKLWTQDMLTRYTSEHPACDAGFCRTKWNKSTPQEKKYTCSKCFLTTGIDNTNYPKGDLISLPPGMTYSACPYYEQVHKAIRSSKVVMNFSSFLYQTQMTNRFDNPRNLLIIDEMHQVESQLLSFVSFSITDQHLKEHGIFIPDLDSALEYAIWFEDVGVYDILLESIKQTRENDNPKLEEELTRVLKKYEMFMGRIKNEQDEWVCEYEEKSNRGNILHRKITLKPVFAQRFAHELLFKYSQRVLMMSATVLDVNVICKSLGIDRKHVAAMRAENKFPKKNRPIYVRPVAKMTGGKSRMHEWAPLLAKGVDKIAEDFKGKKGIVHTHNFAIMDYLLNECSPNVKKRFINQREFNNDKQALLKEHANRKDSIIIAPAMHEGINLIGELSRFQIICKVPYANCFDDKQLAKRVEIDRPYYTWLTAIALVQATGRSVRSKTDYADTFILDESIYRFMDNANRILPKWFKEAIIYETE